jgi:hypothetical protein
MTLLTAATSAEWQSLVAPGIVAIVLVAFTIRWWQAKKSKSPLGCGSSCGCGIKPQMKLPPPSK